MLLGSFMEHGETWHLREIQRVLDEMDEDLADGVPFIPCPALRKFMEIDDPNWDDQDSVRLLSEFFDRWPDTRSFCELRTTDVNLIKRQIVEDRLSIEFRLLRPFILNCKMLISSQGSDTNPQPGKICAIALKLTNNMLRHVALMMPISPEYDTKLLLAVKSALGRALVKARKVDRENPHNVDDPIWEELTLDELFDKHAVALEVGVVKLLFTHAVQQLATAYRHRDRGICSMLEDVVEIEASGFLRQVSRTCP